MKLKEAQNKTEFKSVKASKEFFLKKEPTTKTKMNQTHFKQWNTLKALRRKAKNKTKQIKIK